MLVTDYHLLVCQTAYQDPGSDYDDRRQAERARWHAIQTLEPQGFRVTIESAAQPLPSLSQLFPSSAIKSGARVSLGRASREQGRQEANRETQFRATRQTEPGSKLNFAILCLLQNRPARARFLTPSMCQGLGSNGHRTPHAQPRAAAVGTTCCLLPSGQRTL